MLIRFVVGFDVLNAFYQAWKEMNRRISFLRARNHTQIDMKRL